MGDAVIAADGLTRVFADFWGRPEVTAVDGLDLSVRGGEVFGLLGPNGSGKSTTVKLLLGLLRPTRGSVRVLGRPPDDLATKARVGYLPEESHLYPFLTGAETLQFFARLFDLSRGERARRVDELLAMVGLTGDRDRRVGEYSKGMQRRLGLAQALLNAPDLVILDEPTSGLDPLGMHEVKDLLRSLAAAGRTVLMCSHLLAEVEDVCDRVQILYRGRTLATGTMEELLAETERVRLTVASEQPAATARLIELIRAELGPDAVDIETPTRSLESFFLEVVGEARADERVQPGVAPFLRPGARDG